MTIRFGSAVCLAFGLLASPALAQCTSPTCQPGYACNDPVSAAVKSVVRDWKRNNCWPEPFVYPDRQNVRAPFVLMVSNGWRRQNLLGSNHFQMDAGSLTAAGQEKLRWILTEAPEQHRTVYVTRAYTAQETVARIAAVQKSAAQIMPEGPIPPILETNLTAPGCPAERVDAISRKFQETAPAPRLPAPTNTGDAK
jgi:hypothetical protein